MRALERVSLNTLYKMIQKEAKQNEYSLFSKPSSYPQNQKNSLNMKNKPTLVKERDYSLYGEGFGKDEIDQMESDNRFHKVMQKYTIFNEGGYVNRPNDSGKETKYGISKKTYPHEDIKNLTRERANAILHRDFWKWNGISTLPDEVVGPVFDFGVVSSPLNAIQTTHRALGIEPVGNVIGQTTQNKLKEIQPQEFINKFQNLAQDHFNTLVNKRSKDKEFENGWRNRANRYKSE